MKVIRPIEINTSGTFTRNSIGTYFDKSGVMQVAAINEPRLNYDPITLEAKGLMMESSATNIFHTNSDNPANNIGGLVVELFNIQYTLSFYGTGSVIFSGGHTATVVGSGAFPIRKVHTFTPVGGMTTITVTGTVQYLQIETGATATSYIPTTGAATTRAADVVTGTGLIYTNAQIDAYPEWAAPTNYSFGSRVILTSTKKIYENIQAGIDATPPNLAPTRWVEVSSINPWRPFDNKVGTQAEANEELIFILKPGRVSGIGMINMEASYVEVTMVVPTEPDQTVYSGSANLTTGTIVGDWYEYFFEPIETNDAFVMGNLIDSALPNIPQYNEGIIVIRIQKPTSIARVGNIIVGAVLDIGSTKYESSVGIIDYSKQDTDQFGNITIVQRTFSKRLNVEVEMRNNKVDNIVRTLSRYRSTPLLWIGMDNVYTSMIVYGYYKDWDLVFSGASHSTCKIQIIGLT